MHVLGFSSGSGKVAMKHLTAVRTTAVALTALSLLSFCYYHHPRDLPANLDDAYMSLRYAKHWLAGDGFAWNVEDGLAYGITSVSHLLLVTGLRATTALSDDLLVSILSYSAGIAALVTLVAIGFGMFPRLRSSWAPLLVAPAILLSSSFPYHSLTGMETTLALLFNALFGAAGLAFANKPSAGRLAMCLVTASVSILTRPDMGIYAFLLPSLLLLAEDRTRWKWGVIYSALLALFMVAHLLLNKQFFGDYVPLPFLAKSSGYYRGYSAVEQWNAGKMLFTFLHDALPFLLVIACCVTKKSLPRLTALFVPMLLTFGYYGTVVQIMGMEARYYYPSLPFLVIGCYIALDSFLEQWQTVPAVRSSAFAARACAAFILVIGLNAPLSKVVATSLWSRFLITQPEQFTSREFQTLKEAKELPPRSSFALIKEFDTILSQMPAKITFAASEHGYLGARHSDMPIIDLVGLHDREIATRGFSIEYLLSRQPDLIWMPHPAYTHLHQQILNSDAFIEQYEYYPGCYEYGVAIRKASPQANQVREVLARNFAQSYGGNTLSDYQAKGAKATP
jgi:hypothetical protein